MGRNTRPRPRQTTGVPTMVVSKAAAAWVAAATMAFAAVASVSSSSPGFPGTIQSQPPLPPYPSRKGSGSPDNNDEAGESSSDWDDALIMEEDPLAFVVDETEAIQSLPSDGDGDVDDDGDVDVDVAVDDDVDIDNNHEIEICQSETNDVEQVQVLPELSNDNDQQHSGPESQESIAPPPPPPLIVLPTSTSNSESESEVESLDQQQQHRDGIEKSSSSSATPQQASATNPSAEEQPPHEKESEQTATSRSELSMKNSQRTPTKPAHTGHRHSKDHDRHPSNKKPLQTLEKLQQLLDNTDYLTSSSSTSASGKGLGVDDPQQQQQQSNQNQQQQHTTSSSKSSVPGINSLWTSKDRTKYKKQQRLQKEQIRLKQQQEEQLRMQHNQQLQIQSVSVETEEFSDTDDGLGYTLPNLPVYLSDGEEDTDEAMFFSDPTAGLASGSTSAPTRVATPELSSSSSSSSSSTSAARLLAASQQQQQQRQAMTFAQQQYLQQQRNLFFATQDQQQQQQQQPPPANPLHYPNQQQQQQQQQPPPQPQPQQHPYYGAGQYPPPLPLGFYPYPPPPQYYNGGPLPHPPHPQQYHPSSYYPYRSIPQIEPTVPKNPRQTASLLSSEAHQQPSSQQRGEEESSTLHRDSNTSLEGEGNGEASNAGVVYPQPHPPFDASYYPQSPEQQEQWHRQQLRILQAQEKFERALRRKHQTMVLVANLRSLAVATWKTIGSVRKMSTCMALVACTCYMAVSPRNLHYLEYNRRFYENLQRVALVVLPPLVGYGWLVVDWTQLRLQLQSQSQSGGSASNSASSSATISPNPSLEAPMPASAVLTNGEASSHGSNGSSLRVLEGDPETANSAVRGGSLAGAIHVLIHSFYSSFVFGYLWVFVLEIAWTTFLRLAIFLAWEPDMFGVKLPWSSTPLSAFVGGSATQGQAQAHAQAPPPLLILPWALREYKYRPKRITLLAADILTSCVACPIVEEFVKLRLLQWTMPLSKNFSWVQKSSKHHKNHKKKTIAEPIEAATDETGAASLDGTVTNINPYIAGMLVVSLGIKWADAIRRVCMYTKIQDEQKNVYAFLRGVFPVQELCGVMTALGLARRDVLGQKMPLWKLLLPATIVHSMANLRGMKPIFKWNSSTPWAEMQLSPDLFPGLFSQTALAAMEGAGVNAPLPPTTKLQWLGRAFPKIMWIIILGRAAGYCAKNYFMINRQAVRRATTYAGKHAAFSAELETAEQLKHT